MCACGDLHPSYVCSHHAGMLFHDWRLAFDEDSGQIERQRANDELSRHTFETPWRSNDT